MFFLGCWYAVSNSVMMLGTSGILEPPVCHPVWRANKWCLVAYCVGELGSLYIRCVHFQLRIFSVFAGFIGATSHHKSGSISTWFMFWQPSVPFSSHSAKRFYWFFSINVSHLGFFLLICSPCIVIPIWKQRLSFLNVLVRTFPDLRASSFQCTVHIPVLEIFLKHTFLNQCF